MHQERAVPREAVMKAVGMVREAASSFNTITIQLHRLPSLPLLSLLEHLS